MSHFPSAPVPESPGVISDQLTQASFSRVLEGVSFKSVKTLWLCTARTSKQQAKLFEQLLPSIFRGSDGISELDNYEVTV